MPFSKTVPAVAVFTVLAAAVLGGCSAKESTDAATPSASADEIAVDATDSACALSATQAGKGTRTFVITNNGTKVTEFYVYGKDDQVLAEAENISPGLKRTLEVEFTEPGTYQTACKPGMTGDGIRAALTVND